MGIFNSVRRLFTKRKVQAKVRIEDLQLQMRHRNGDWSPVSSLSPVDPDRASKDHHDDQPQDNSQAVGAMSYPFDWGSSFDSSPSFDTGNSWSQETGSPDFGSSFDFGGGDGGGAGASGDW